MHNVTGYTSTRQGWGAVLGIVEAVFAGHDSELVCELYHLTIDEIGGFLRPKSAEFLEDAELGTLTYLDFP